MTQPRTFNGRTRTACACKDCSAHCRHIPGYLLPEDIPAIAAALEASRALAPTAAQNLLLDNLAASPGALLGDSRTGRTFRLPTIVPAVKPDGSCVFLQPDGRCEIHAAAPFGCAFFDSHQGAAQAHDLSAAGLRSLLHHALQGGPYTELWAVLNAAGHTAEAPEVRRAKAANSINSKE